jgi:hypothetical protein
MVGPPGPSSIPSVQHVTRRALSAAAADRGMHYDLKCEQRTDTPQRTAYFMFLYFGFPAGPAYFLSPFTATQAPAKDNKAVLIGPHRLR